LKPFVLAIKMTPVSAFCSSSLLHSSLSNQSINLLALVSTYHSLIIKMYLGLFEETPSWDKFYAKNYDFNLMHIFKVSLFMKC